MYSEQYTSFTGLPNNLSLMNLFKIQKYLEKSNNKLSNVHIQL